MRFLIFLHGTRETIRDLARLFKTDAVYLVDVLFRLGRGLDVGHSPLLGTVLRLLDGHLPPLVQVALVSHQQEGDVFIVLHSKDLLSVSK